MYITTSNTSERTNETQHLRLISVNGILDLLWRDHTSTATSRAPSYQTTLPTVRTPVLRPRHPTIVAPGIAPPRTGDGILSESQRLHLQSWLNDCRRCSMNGIHRAAFSSENQGFRTPVLPKTPFSATFLNDEIRHDEGKGAEDSAEQDERQWQTIYLATPPETLPTPGSASSPPRTFFIIPPATTPTEESASPTSIRGRNTIRHEQSLASLITSNLRSPASASQPQERFRSSFAF